MEESEEREQHSGFSLPHCITFSMTAIYFFAIILLTTSVVSVEPPSRLTLLRFFMGFGPEVNTVQKISFNPEAGQRFREQYERKYGPRGQLLIERLGQGLGPQGPPLVDIDQLLEPSKNKTKHYRTYDFTSPKSKLKKDVKIKIQLTPNNDEDQAEEK